MCLPARPQTHCEQGQAPFCSYLSWGYRCGFGRKELIPVLEPYLYEYLTHLRYTSAAPTKAASVMSAVSFVAHCLGSGGSLAATTSLRCIGSAHRQYLLKRPRQQALPVPMWVVVVLELCSSYCRCPKAKFTGGYGCLLVHGRLRNSDAKRIVRIWTEAEFDERGWLSGGFAEALALGTKTANTAEKKTAFLPVTAILKGLSDRDWFSGLDKARLQMGLPPLVHESALEREVYEDEPDELPMPIFPSGILRGRPAQQGAKADEVTEAVRQLLKNVGVPPEVVSAFSSNSAKATWRSVFATAGVDDEVLEGLLLDVLGAVLRVGDVRPSRILRSGSFPCCATSWSTACLPLSLRRVSMPEPSIGTKQAGQLELDGHARDVLPGAEEE